MMLVPNPETSPRLYNCLRWFGLVVGCFAKFVTGSLFVFNSYEGALKATFNYTETEVELQSSLLNVGLGLGFLPGIFYDKFGPTWTSFAGLIVSVGSYLLLWSTTRYVPFYKGNSWLMAIYFFLCGFGSVFTYMVALNTNVLNFHTEHRGKIVGLLNAFCAGSPSVFAVVYYNVFAGEGIAHVDSFGNFMLCFAVTFGVCNILCVLFLHKYTYHLNQEYEPLLIDNNSQESINSSVKTGSINTTIEESQPMAIKKLLLNLNYHLFAWMLAFAASVGQVYVNNVTEIAATVLRTSVYNSNLVLIIPIVNSVVSVSIGLLSDKFKHKIPRIAVFILGSLFFLISQIVVLLLADEYVFLVIGTTFCGMGIGIIWSMGPTIVSEMFFVENIGRNWGIAMLFASVLGFIQQEIFGIIYDANITTAGSIYCYGMHCIRGGVAMSLSSAFVSIVIGSVLLIKRTRKRQSDTGSKTQ